MRKNLLSMAGIVSILCGLAACGTLPQEGPSTRQFHRPPPADPSQSYAIIDLNYSVSEFVSQRPPSALGSLGQAGALRPNDLINAGDTLAVTVLEPGGSLFGGAIASAPSTNRTAASATQRTTSQNLPPLAVDRSGAIEVPFAGRVVVSGMTVSEASIAIGRALRGRAVNPQVIVYIEDSVTNGATVLGSVASPGRQGLRNGADTVLDVIAAAGGPSRPAEDIQIVVTREGRSFEAPLTTLLSTPSENVRLSPGDQINLVSRPRRYSTFGAVGDVSQVDMPAGDVTLTDALGRAGGLDNSTADARSVYVFRFERPEIARELGVNLPPSRKGVPVVYRLDLTQPTGFFTANTFTVQADDVIYAPRASSAELRKFFELVRSVTQVVYDVRAVGLVAN